MRKLSFILAIVMLLTSMLAFTACGGDKDTDKPDNKDEAKTIAPADAVLEDMVNSIEAKAPYTDLVAEFLYKETDPDEMLMWTYGVIDLKANDLVSDYVITMPSDYSQTLCIIKFNDGMTAEDFTEVKDAVTEWYLKDRASALQMYMPEEYAAMQWAIENPDAIWRQYGDNMLVLAIYGDKAPNAVWTAIDDYFAGK